MGSEYAAQGEQGFPFLIGDLIYSQPEGWWGIIVELKVVGYGIYIGSLYIANPNYDFLFPCMMRDPKVCSAKENEVDPAGYVPLAESVRIYEKEKRRDAGTHG